MRLRIAAAALLAAVVTFAGSPAHSAPSNEDCSYFVATNQVFCGPNALARAGDIGINAVLAASFYDRANYDAGGGVWNWYVPVACTPSYSPLDYWHGNLGSFGWSNRISSLKTYNRCDVKLFDGTYYGTPSTTWIDRSADLRLGGVAWSNRASSLQMS